MTRDNKSIKFSILLSDHSLAAPFKINLFILNARKYYAENIITVSKQS